MSEPTTHQESAAKQLQSTEYEYLEESFRISKHTDVKTLQDNCREFWNIGNDNIWKLYNEQGDVIKENDYRNGVKVN